MALLVDVRIRQKSGGTRSLDSFMRDSLAPSAEQPLTETALIAALERETGEGFVTQLIDAKEHIDLSTLYQALGLEVVSPSEVKLTPSALRDALQQDRGGPRGAPH